MSPRTPSSSIATGAAWRPMLLAANRDDRERASLADDPHLRRRSAPRSAPRSRSRAGVPAATSRPPERSEQPVGVLGREREVVHRRQRRSARPARAAPRRARAPAAGGRCRATSSARRAGAAAPPARAPARARPAAARRRSACAAAGRRARPGRAASSARPAASRSCALSSPNGADVRRAPEQDVLARRASPAAGAATAARTRAAARRRAGASPSTSSPSSRIEPA